MERPRTINSRYLLLTYLILAKWPLSFQDLLTIYLHCEWIAWLMFSTINGHSYRSFRFLSDMYVHYFTILWVWHIEKLKLRSCHVAKDSNFTFVTLHPTSKHLTDARMFWEAVVWRSLDIWEQWLQGQYQCCCVQYVRCLLFSITEQLRTLYFLNMVDTQRGLNGLSVRSLAAVVEGVRRQLSS